MLVRSGWAGDKARAAGEDAAMLAPPTPGTHRFALALLTLGLTACAADRSDFTRAADPTDAAFDPDHVLQVEVELTDPDWAELGQLAAAPLVHARGLLGRVPRRHP